MRAEVKGTQLKPLFSSRPSAYARPLLALKIARGSLPILSTLPPTSSRRPSHRQTLAVTDTASLLDRPGAAAFQLLLSSASTAAALSGLGQNWGGGNVLEWSDELCAWEWSELCDFGLVASARRWLARRDPE